MESKDTIMPLECSVLDALHCTSIADSKILRALEAQAELSFRAGIREVVEWIQSELSGDGHIVWIKAKDWQTKLKEWGIDKGVNDDLY